MSNVDDKTAALNLKRHNLTINDKAEDVGLMKTNSTTEAKSQDTERNKKDKKSHELHQFLHLIEQARMDAEQLHNLINMQIEQLGTNISEATIQRNLLHDKVNVVGEAIENFEATGQFDLNDDGTFKNATLEAATQEWEAEHGEINRDNHALLNHIFETKLEEYKQEINALDKNIDQWERAKRDFEDIEKRLDQAAEKLNSDSPYLQKEGAQEIQDIDLNTKQRLAEHETISNVSSE